MNKKSNLMFESSGEKTIRHTAKWFVRLTTTLLIAVLLGGCSQEEAVIPKEGDVVTWKQTPQLIIKTKLGQRREHIPSTCAPCEADFYHPEREHYVGQFPIDFVPEKSPPLRKAEAEKLPMPYSDHQLEFSFMLNGGKGKATDDSPYGLRGLDNPNQVKVFVSGYKLNLSNAHLRDEPERIDTRQLFEEDLIKELDISKKETKAGLDCFSFKSGQGGKRCFGHSTHPLISGFHFYVSPDPKSNIYGQSHEFIYGGLTLEWFTDQKNLYQAQEIDAAIWRLLEAWNVSPNQTNH